MLRPREIEFSCLDVEYNRNVQTFSSQETRSLEKSRISEDNRKRWTILVTIVTFVPLFVLLISALRKTCGPVEKNKCKNLYIDEWSLI
jgi:hypothetical protein